MTTVFSCPWPTITPDHPDPQNNLPCDARCDNVAFTEQEWNSVLDFYTIISTFGTMGALFVFLTWFISKRRVTQPRIMYLAVANFFLSSIYFVTMVGGGPSKMLCADNTWTVTTGSWTSFCVFQGWLIQFASMSQAFWWFSIAFDTYANIIGSRKIKRLNRRTRNIYSICVVVPFIISTCTVLAGGVDYSVNNAQCFITSADNHIWQYIFYYVPICSAFLAGGFLVFLIIVHVGDHLRGVKSQSSLRRAAKSYKHTLIRLVLFLMAYQFIFAVVVSYKIVQGVSEGDWEDAVAKWLRDRGGYVMTHMATWTEQELNEEFGTHPEPRFPLGLLYALAFSSAGSGISLFLVFGTIPKHITVWKEFFSKAYRSWLWGELEGENAPPHRPYATSSSVNEKSTGDDESTNDQMALELVAPRTKSSSGVGGGGGGGALPHHLRVSPPPCPVCTSRLGLPTPSTFPGI